MTKKSSKVSRGERVDARGKNEIAASGWEITARPGDGHARWVAVKVVRSDDEERRLFESSYTLDGLARQVRRREVEEGFSKPDGGPRARKPVRVIDGVRDSARR
jgi:hypothetical protein